jgi:hypothetical protein
LLPGICALQAFPCSASRPSAPYRMFAVQRGLPYGRPNRAVSAEISIAVARLTCRELCFLFGVWQPAARMKQCVHVGNTTGMVKDADGQRLRRRPNVGAVGVGYI